ncbi:MAG: SIR2 family NAD-dependent protein deacylase, partial [Gammaproteobacteria bacterium]
LAAEDIMRIVSALGNAGAVSLEIKMDHSLEEEKWELLLERIKDGKCTPFLGAGACFGTLPLGSDIAREWANKLHYPLKDSSDLARVAQFLAVTKDPMYPKEEILKRIKSIAPPDFNAPDDPHGILAELPLPIYITTNYDDFMVQALKSRNKTPRQELCHWNEIVRRKFRSYSGNFKSSDEFSVNSENPVVFHLHGHTGLAESLVLTEDDYLDFLVSISKDEDLIPPRIQEAMASTTLLFLGYKLADWDFRVLFRSLVSYIERSISRSHVSVQIITVGDVSSEADKENAQKYLDHYFEKHEIRMYWGTCKDFARELRERWQAFDHGD